MMNHGLSRTGFASARPMEMNRMRIGKLLLAMTSALAALCAAQAATTLTAEDFRLDLSGMGPWEARTAAASEQIAWSSVWATNASAGANAVVKVYPAKREKPVALAVAGWIGSP